MKLNRLEITDVRNLKSLKFTCAARYNLIHGENGSGKTSILEAIYLLALGRSFRSHLKSRSIHHQAESLSVFGQIYTADELAIPAGIQKFVNGQTQLRLNQQRLDSILELAKLLPLQLLNPDSYELVSSGSKVRRQFIDWGVFHVEQQFYLVWSKVERILKQRNAALKQHASRNEIISWDKEFSELAQQLNEMRVNYLEKLLPVVKEFSAVFVGFPSLEIEYSAGWETTQPLNDCLAQTLARDLLYGYTKLGPQRANLQIRAENKPAHDVLSRGQQKVLVFILRFAQAELLKRQQNKNCIYLIDDLAAELDLQRRQQIIDVIKSLSGQFFITGIDLLGLECLCTDEKSKIFHIQQGVIV